VRLGSLDEMVEAMQPGVVCVSSARAGTADRLCKSGDSLETLRAAAGRGPVLACGGQVFNQDPHITECPGGSVPHAHIHPHQTERFEVLSGTLQGRIGRRAMTVKAGEAIVVPPGVPHTWWNRSDAEVDAIIEFRPALNSEAMFRTIWGLAAEGKVTRSGRPYLLQLAVLLDEYQNEMAPPLVTRPVFAILARIGRLLGYRGRYIKERQS
jgi:quercetin dioxygenase-like cupin family protein